MRRFAMPKTERIDQSCGWRKGEKDEIEELARKICEQKPICPDCGNQEVGVLPNKPLLEWNCDKCGATWQTNWDLKAVDPVEELLKKVGKLAAGNRKFAMLENLSAGG